MSWQTGRRDPDSFILCAPQSQRVFGFKFNYRNQVQGQNGDKVPNSNERALGEIFHQRNAVTDEGEEREL